MPSLKLISYDANIVSFLFHDLQAWITLIGEKLDATLAKVVDRIPLGVEERS